MTAEKELMLIELHTAFRREDIPSGALRTYDNVSRALRDQYVADEISADIVLDTLDNMAYELTYVEDSAWMDNLLKMMEVKS